MSTSRQNGAGGVQAIPAVSRKIVQSVKEIVNCPEAEIYAALKECNMDPNEAVNRLMTQDPFHEVKSKREKKKKEGKESTESRPRGGGGNASSRGGRAGSDRYHSRGSSVPHNYSESTNYHGKSPSYPKENGSNPRASFLSSTPGSLGINRNRVPPSLGDSASTENKGSSVGTGDVAQPPSGYRSAWGGGHGQVSMADIVKMGRPHGKPFDGPNASHHNFQGASHSDLKSPEEQALKENWSEHSSVQPRSTNDEWPSIEKPATVQVASVSGYNAESEQHLDSSFGQHSDEEEIRDAEGDDEKSGENSSGKITEEGPRGVSRLESNLYEATSSHEPQSHNFEHHAVEEVDVAVSSLSRNLQQLNVDSEERDLSSEEYAPSVKIPDHLQVQSADFSHLSFGSFGSGMNFSYSSGIMTSTPVTSQLDEEHIEDNVPPAELPETRSSEYYADNSLRNASDSSLFHRSGTDAGSYDPSSASKQEDLKPDSVEHELSHGNQYPFPSGNQGYAYDDPHHLNTTFTQTSSHLQNLAPLSNVVQSYNTLPNTLSAAGVHPNREADLHYSPFPGTQSMPAKYANSTMDSSAITMSEALKTAGLSSTQPAAQTITGTSVATGPPLPQHLAMHPYSQPTLSLGPFANIMGYPFLPQSYTYLPSAFQQAFAGNNAYHQSLASAAALPQYKNSVSGSSLPQSAAIASGYGAFGNASTNSGNFQMNPPSAPSGTNLSYDEVLSSQYKDNSHLVSLSQNENPAMWLQGHNSRTLPAMPASNYYNYPGQSQPQPSGFRQGQQPSQNYGALGYANFYHSQAGLTLDQQQNNARDASLSGAQGQPKQSQIWQNNY